MKKLLNKFFIKSNIYFSGLVLVSSQVYDRNVSLTTIKKNLFIRGYRVSKKAHLKITPTRMREN